MFAEVVLFKISINVNREQQSTRFNEASPVRNGQHKSTATYDHGHPGVVTDVIGAGW